MVPLSVISTEPGPRRTAPPPVSVAACDQALLWQLRIAALDCRAAAREDVFQACAMLSEDRDAARTAFAEAMMKCLPQAIGKAPKILAPAVLSEVSFDEAWLLQLVAASGRQDTDSMWFLLRSRVAAPLQRHVAFLANGLSEHFSKS